MVYLQEVLSPQGVFDRVIPFRHIYFCVCEEALSSLLSKADGTSVLEGVPMSRRGPRLNHLFFANDGLLFC
jgi:hypothetical protein